MVFIIHLNTYCQVTRVTYKNGIYGQKNDSIKLNKEKFKDLTKENITSLEAFLKNQVNVEFELLYDANCSIFQRKEILISESNKMEQLNSMMNNNQYFKNNILNEKLFQTTLDKLYNVIVPFDEYKWNISNETKTINGYLCYKATCKKEDLFNPYKNSKSIFYPEVWFSPDIPSSFGPQGFDGLPGLVLEATLNGKKYLYATKIEFNIKDGKKIEKFQKGKTITSEELEKLIIDDYKKSQEN